MKETKLCKHCQTELQCRKKQGGIVKCILIGILAVLVIGIMAGCEKNKPQKIADSSDNTSEEKTTNQEVKDTFAVGETAEMNDVQVTLTSYKQSKGSEFNKPSDGNEFVLIEFEIVNNSDSEIAISSIASFEAYADDYALNYSLESLLEKGEQNQLDGTVASGKKMKGVIGYEVPIDWKNIEVHFVDNVWSNNKWKFEIVK